MLAPKFRRIVMHSPTLLQNATVAPTAYLRFWFPDPADPEVEQQRGYTLAWADQDTGAFACDFVLHEPAGPASAWASTAEPGTTVQATSLGSTRFDLPAELPAGYLLIGDAASIPAINAILSELPAEVPAEVYLEEHDPDDRLIPLTHHPRATIRWVPRVDETTLAASIEARDWSDWYVWTAPESSSLKLLRKRLKEEFGFPRSETHAQAYWYYGRAFGSNRSKAKPEASQPAATTQPAVVAQPATPAEAAETPRASSPPPASASEPAASSTAPAASASASAATSPAGRWRAQAAGRLLRPLKPVFITAGIVQGLLTLLELVPYVLLLELARRLLTGAPAAELWTLGIWALGLMALGIALTAVLMLWLHWVDARFSRALRTRLLAQLSRLPLGWFDAKGSGRVKQLVQDDTLSLHYLVTHAVADAVAAAIAPLAVLVYLFVVDWRLALVLFVPVFAYVFGMMVMVFQSGPKTGEHPGWVERMNVEAGAYLEGQPVIRVFGGGAASTFRARLSEYIKFLDDWQRPLGGQKTFIDQVTRPATFLALICLVGTLLVTTGGMDPVSLLPFLFLGTTFGARLLGIGYGLAGLQEGMLAARRLQVVLDEPPLRTRDAEGTTASGPVPASVSPGTVEFDGVGFSYRPGVPVLEDVTLRLEPGTITALVGPSGSGKSTLASLLARFHDVVEGAIRVGGRDLRDLTPDELYAQVGFVFQQIQLVEGTVRENIALAVPDATDQQVEHAARAARIHDRIMQLPHGYDTQLGPDAALSGGEKQRLTIARAILADTPVLVLDEATAFADPESEFLVQQALTELTANRTVLVIAHRLHTLTGVDEIVVLDHGRIVQAGTHAQLVGRAGRYRDLWEARGRPAAQQGGAELAESSGLAGASEPAGASESLAHSTTEVPR
jgi:ATP-binding cassette subfamily B protein IrtA